MVVMSHDVPFSMKTLIGVILFFGIGVTIGVSVTLMMLARRFGAGSRSIGLVCGWVRSMVRVLCVYKSPTTGPQVNSRVLNTGFTGVPAVLGRCPRNHPFLLAIASAEGCVVAFSDR